MNRRKFLRSAALLPALPVVAIAGPTPEGKRDIRSDRFVMRVPEHCWRQRAVKEWREALGRWERGEDPALAIPDSFEILRA